MNRAAVPNLLFTPTWVPGHPRARAQYAPSISKEVWDRHRDEIIELYIQLDWKLDDVMRVMETYNLFATKRQYTKKLRDWGCRKYNIHLKTDATSEPIPVTQDASFTFPDTAFPVVLMEPDGIARGTAPASSHRELHLPVGAATATDSNITNGKVDAGPKAATAQQHIAALGGNNNPWARGTGGIVRDLSVDAEMMDGALISVLEERSASSLSKIEDASVEDASIRDYSSVSSVNLAPGPTGSLQRSPFPSSEVPASPVRDVALAVQLWGSAGQDVMSSTQHADTTDAHFDWDTGETIAATEVTLDIEFCELYAGNHSSAYPVLVTTPALTREVSPTALLLMIESGRVSGELSDGDISRIEQLAESFECARSYEDAYQLRRLVLLQANGAHRRDSMRDYASGRALVNVLKNANNKAAYKEAAAFVKQEWREPQDRARENSITKCVQQSYLGSMFRARTDFRSAEQHCRCALDRMLLLYAENASVSSKQSRDFIAGWLVVVTNLFLTWEDKDPKSGSNDVWIRIQALCHFRLSMAPEVREQWRLPQVLGWCLNTLTEDGLWKMLLPITPDLWLLAPNEADLADAESTLLFFYLFSQMQPGHFAAQNSRPDSVQSQASCVFDFALAWGVSVPEALSVIANLIIVGNRPHERGEKSTLARRASATTMTMYNSMKAKGSSMDFELVFMESYATIWRQKDNQFSTENYAKLIRSVVRDIVERNFHLKLEVSALRDPRLQDRLSQASTSPSYSPTMLSTPRSSWSGFRSFKSIGRRGSKFWANTNNSNNDVASLLSSHRWSRASSTKSAKTLQSTTPSDRDVIMEDE